MGTQTCEADGTFGMCICGSGGLDAGPDASGPGHDGALGIDASTTMMPPTVLASGLYDPFELALTSTAVFWTDTGGLALPFRGDVSTVNKDGTGEAGIVLALNRPTQIATDGLNIYWFNEQDGTLQYSDITGATVSTPINESNGKRLYGDLTIHANKLFFISNVAFGTSGGMFTYDINPFNAGSAVELRNIGGFASGEATDATNVFYLDMTNGTLGKSPMTPDMMSNTGEVTNIAVGFDQPIAVAVDAAPGVFVAERGTGFIDVVDKKGGGITTLAFGVDPVALALDATYVYWCEEATGQIWKVARDGSAAPTLIMGGQQNPISLAVDADSLYWLNRGTLAATFMDGSLNKIAK